MNSPEEIITAWTNGGTDSGGHKPSLLDYISALKTLLSHEPDRKDLTELFAQINSLNQNMGNTYIWALSVYHLVGLLAKMKVPVYDGERAVLAEMRDYALENFEIIRRSYQNITVLNMAEYIVVSLRNIDRTQKQHHIYDSFERTKASFAADGIDWDPVNGASVSIP